MGVEVASLIESVEAFDLQKQEMRLFTREECHFGYRDSIFKHEWRNTYAICYVTFRLSKIFNPVCQYAGIMERISDPTSLTLPLLREIILAIRQEKLPDPAVWGNAGSYFMNPVIEENDFRRLKEKYPTMPGWPADHGRYKISAAWCIEQAGWKGKQVGRAGVYPNQPLVIVNRGGASAADILNLAEQIQKDVYNLLGVQLIPEVLYI
jgi:UDP-N-acetylmuramate dehydrogenase